MKKLLLALFAMALLAAFTTPVHAAKKMKKPAMKKAKKKAPAGVSLKLKGFYRVRAYSANNLDQDDDNDDSTQGIDSLVRPNFLTTVGKGHIKGRWEIDWWETDGGASANAVWGNNKGGRVGVGTNRWHVDFAVPGSALRVRFGREDYTSPDKEIFDSAGVNRKPGIGLYGKLSKNMSLSMFMVRGGNADLDTTSVGPSDDNNADSYFAALGIKVSPTVTLTPWVAMHRNGVGKSLTYAALHAKAKVGIFGVSATGVSVGGDASASMDASGWAMLVRSSASLGKLKLMANLTMLSGDDNDGDNEEGRFSSLFPNAGDVRGGLLITGRGEIFAIDANERVAGQKTRHGRYGQVNGAFAADFGIKYQVSKTLNLGAGIYILQSAEADVEGDEDFGTEFDVGMEWKIYPKLALRAGFGYLAAGDYGADNDKEDSWMTAVSLRHIF